MTEIDSPTGSRHEETDENIDVSILISEVKRRPKLYIKTPGECIDRETKQKLWSEVCQALFMAWNDYDLKKKKEKVREVQSKWRYLKDTFTRQYAAQTPLTPSGKKKRKYYHYDSLCFLIPTMAQDLDARLDNNNDPETVPGQKNQDAIPSTSSNIPNVGESSQQRSITQEGAQETEAMSEDPIVPSSVSNNIPNTEETMEESLEEAFPQIVAPGVGPILVPKVDDSDENTYFALMLVPMMNKFNEEQRYYARNEILRIMRQISLMGKEKISVCNPDLLKYPEEEGSVLQNVLDIPEAGEAPEPLPEPSFIKRSETGEIQYPETDPEDFDV